MTSNDPPTLFMNSKSFMPCYRRYGTAFLYWERKSSAKFVHTRHYGKTAPYGHIRLLQAGGKGVRFGVQDKLFLGVSIPVHAKKTSFWPSKVIWHCRVPR